MTTDPTLEPKRKHDVWYIAAWTIACIASTIGLFSCVTGGPLWFSAVSISIAVVSMLVVIRADRKAATNPPKPSESAQT